MRTHKRSIISMFLLSIICLTSSIILEYKLDRFLNIDYKILSGHRAFCISILLSILTGALIVFITSIISYLAMRKEIIVQYWIKTMNYNLSCWELDHDF